MASIKKNLLFNFILSASQLLLPLISIPYISHVLDPDGIGKVSFVDSLTYYFISIAEFGIVVYGMREVARVRSNKAALSTLVSELITLHIISSLITICLYVITILILWPKVHDVRLILFSFAFLLVNSFACEWYYYGTEQFRYITSRSVLTRLCGLVMIFILVKQPDHYYIYYATIAGSAILNILFNIGGVVKNLSIRLPQQGWKRHIRKTWVTYGISILYSISLMLDNVLLGLVSAAAFVAYYSFAVKLARLSALALTDTLLVYFPHIVALLHQNEKEKFQQAILRNAQLLNLFSLPIGAGLFLLSTEIAAVVFGPSFMPVALDLRILSIVPFLRCYNLFLSKQVLIAYDQERLYLKSLLITAIVFVPATLLLSYYFQDVGASVSMVVYEGTLLLLNYFYARKVDSSLKIFEWKSIIHGIAGAALFVPIILLARQWREPDWLWLTVVILTATIVYLLFQLFVLRNELMLSLRAWSIQYLNNQLLRQPKE